MKVASWNVNSLRPRLPQVLAWLKETGPDIVLLQETKVVDELFPRQDLEDAGYNVACHGQKTYNGVAILSRYPLDDLRCGLPTMSEDTQARYIEAFTGGMRVASVYIPNGQAPGTEKFDYKLSFCAALTQHMREVLTYDETLVLAGDYNITFDDQDVYDPEAWREQILCTLHERQALRTLVNVGLHDALAVREARDFTWWDYRQGAFIKDQGLRIDHLLVSSHALDRLHSAGVDRGVRSNEQPSDHAPVWCQLSPADR